MHANTHRQPEVVNDGYSQHTQTCQEDRTREEEGSQQSGSSQQDYKEGHQKDCW